MSTFPTEHFRHNAEPGISALRERFERKRNASRSAIPNHASRLSSLKLLQDTLFERQADIVLAVNDDFGGRARQETLALELAPLVDAIRHARRPLAGWMKPHRVRAAFNFFPAPARIVLQLPGLLRIIRTSHSPVFPTSSPP